MRWGKLCVQKKKGGIGFRKLHEFNLALLGKQGWRLVNSSESLVVRIFKGKYYHDVEFLSAKLGSSPSYVWRSILQVQELVKKELNIRVGDGATVFVFNDPWLAVDVSYIATHSNEELKDITVQSLMNVDSKSWDEDILRELASTNEVRTILSIPLSSRRVGDEWAWKYERKGSYSIKSGYRVLIAKNGIGLIGGVHKSVWKYLWAFTVPPKVKNFLWRACTDCIPTGSTLMSKRVEISKFCPLCHASIETPLHILVNCPLARGCWVQTEMGSVISHHGSFEEWLA